jgi:RND family efflux transporter MFP subunit
MEQNQALGLVIMPSKQSKNILARAALTGMALSLILILFSCTTEDEAQKSSATGHIAPVEAAPIQHGPITRYRTFNGSLEAEAEFIVAPKISGRVERLAVDLADPVTRGQVVAELDDDEYIQAMAQARADLTVAKAKLVEADNGLEIAGREFERVKTLKKRGVASESQLDTIMANLSAKQAQVEVARAQVARSEALLETARIRLGYTRVTADWSGGDDRRIVAERYVDAGNTVSANAPLLLIVELDPITGIIFVTEKDYAHLQKGQTVQLSTDAYAGETFAGRITRISPIFRQETRQARVELKVDNPQFRLKPGMFIRATVQMESLNDATIVPDSALTTRDDQTGVFVVNEADMTVSWHPVQVGIRQGNRVQVEGEDLTGQVVTLGHQLIDEGSPITMTNVNQQESRTP